jgi:threonyl-tRNA synthetase
LERIPYVLVVGDDDVAHETVGVNPRGGEVIRDVKFADFVKQLQDETVDLATDVTTDVSGMAL